MTEWPAPKNGNGYVMPDSDSPSVRNIAYSMSWPLFDLMVKTLKSDPCLTGYTQIERECAFADLRGEIEALLAEELGRYID
jgi:hypothetical protein